MGLHDRLSRNGDSLNGVDDAHVMRIIDKIVSQIGRRVDESSPMVDARLPDGSRVNAIIPPLALTGPTLTIRKFARDPYTLNDLISFGTLPARAAQFLGACVRGKMNMLISGGTGTGKTTTLNAVSAFIPDDERIVTIEDAAELQLQQDHVITLESRPSNIEGSGEIKIRELVRNALRMRPDRIIVGEVRGAEVLDMLQAMNTGHEGSLTTIHANDTQDALARLELMAALAGFDVPVGTLRRYLASSIDLVVQLARLKGGARRRRPGAAHLGGAFQPRLRAPRPLDPARRDDDPGARRRLAGRHGVRLPGVLRERLLGIGRARHAAGPPGRRRRAAAAARP